MHAVVLNLPSTSGVIYSGSGCVLFHETYETTGSATAQYTLWDNTTNTGTRLLTVTLSAGQSTRDYVRKHYMPFRTALYYHLDSGSVTGSVSLLLEHSCDLCWNAYELGVMGVMGGLSHHIPPATVGAYVAESGLTPDGSPPPEGVEVVPVAGQTEGGPPASRPAYVWPGPGTDYFVPEPQAR